MSGDIAGLRHDLDVIDRELIELFEKRMEVSGEIAAYKRERGLPVLDAGREEQVINTRMEMLSDSRLKPYAKALFVEVMRLSRLMQEDLLKRGDAND